MQLHCLFQSFHCAKPLFPHLENGDDPCPVIPLILVEPARPHPLPSPHSLPAMSPRHQRDVGRQRLSRWSSLSTPPLGPGCLTRRLWEAGAERGPDTRLATPRQVLPYRSAVPFHPGPVWFWEQSLGLLFLLAAAAWPVGTTFSPPWVISRLVLGLQLRSPLTRDEGQAPALPRLLGGQEHGSATGGVSWLKALPSGLPWRSSG